MRTILWRLCLLREHQQRRLASVLKTGILHNFQMNSNIMNPNESVINKVQHRYWVTKQTVFRKLGKKEDEFIVSSDAELDAKLELFKSVQESSRNLLRIISQYQSNLNVLAVEESEMGYFMKSAGKSDKTRAGKMMVAVGTSVLYSGQQRFTLQRPLERLYQKLETFHRRAIADTCQVIQCMERARTEYRASLNWMKDISQELDPDTYKQMERFKKVQDHVKKSKARFDHLKHVVATKIDVLVASRSNMFSNLLLVYEKSLLEFTGKCVNTFTVITSSFKGYQHYDFCVVKELSDLKPDSSIIAHKDSDDQILDLETVQDENDTDNKTQQESPNLVSLETDNNDDDIFGDFFSASSTYFTPSKPLIDPSVSAAPTTHANIFLPSQILSLHQPSELFTDVPGKQIPALKNLSHRTSSKPGSWYDLFAELDPLTDPDSVCKTFDEQQRKC